MLEKALNSPRTPQSSKSALNKRKLPTTPKTPKSSLKSHNLNISSPKTPKSSVKFVPGTPKSGKNKVKNA